MEIAMQRLFLFCINGHGPSLVFHPGYGSQRNMKELIGLPETFI